MQRALAGACIAVALFTACGSDKPAATPTPAAGVGEGLVPGGGIFAPADHTRDVVDQLDQQQNNLDKRTGDGYGRE